MKIKLLSIVIAAVSLVSCSTAYKSGQTPDDVYYSPVKVIEEKETRKNDETNKDNYEDREIRMSTYDYRWRDLNDYYGYNYSYNPYQFGYNYGYYYNPYYYNRPVYIPGCVIVNPKNSTPRTTNLASYSNNTLVVSNAKTGETKWVKSSRSYNNSNNNGGSFIRRILTSTSTSGMGNTGSGYNSNNNTRSYSPSNSGGSSRSYGGGSSSGGSSGGGSVSRPGRGN